ncbi:MAG: spore photoproduct lyase family protein [Bacillota bacterium]
MFPEQIFFEPCALEYELGKKMKDKYGQVPWIPIENHNNIEELRKNSNKEFAHMKKFLVIGIRKTHKYTPNQKVSDFLVPYTSSGCSAMCLYCYLVCNYNKCSYLRLFVNREQMLDKIIKTAIKSEKELTFEIGSNSDLILENTITNNLEWTIENFSKKERGFLTFPTKFHMVDPILHLNHKGRIITRMSVNPQPIITKVEFGTSSLDDRITAINKLGEAGYSVGLLIAPIVLMAGWKELYSNLIDQLNEKLLPNIKKKLFIEIIFMTYSFIHCAINEEAFPKAVKLYDQDMMTGRGRGKYCYREGIRAEAEDFLREELSKKLPGIPILYIV